MDIQAVGHRPFIVAEMGANHNGSLKRALAIIDAAAAAGADAIKLQTWSPDYMVVDKGYTITGGAWDGHNLANLYRAAQTPWIWHELIFTHARSKGLLPFSAPFDIPSLMFLERGCDCELYKIASCEIVDLGLVAAVASTGKPMIISTGMASYHEIHRAVETATKAGCKDITLLKCTSAYPALERDANLATMLSMQMAFSECSVGLSDHTMGGVIAVAAATLGAKVIEKHLTLSRADGGLDAGFSMEPNEFAQMVRDCRIAASAIGAVRFGPGEGECTDLRRSLWLIEDIAAGEVLEPRHVRSARPALGLECYRLSDAIGRAAVKSYAGGQPLRMEMLA